MHLNFSFRKSNVRIDSSSILINPFLLFLSAY